MFFFDTALALDLGTDTIARFGVSDVLVTATPMRDGNGDGIIGFGDDALLDLPSFGGGTIGITNMAGAAVRLLEYDGSVEREGVTYYLYSGVG